MDCHRFFTGGNSFSELFLLILWLLSSKSGFLFLTLYYTPFPTFPHGERSKTIRSIETGYGVIVQE